MSHTLSPEDVTILRRATGDLVVKEENGYFAAIDHTLTPELRREGVARELVSRVQRLRRELGFAVSDRITLNVFGDATVQEAVAHYTQWIADEVLALKVQVASVEGATNATHHLDLDGQAVQIAITRIV